MRISDWSSDVCSSDLIVHVVEAVRHRAVAPGVGNTRDRGRVTDSRLVVTVVGAPEGIELAEQVSLLVDVLRRAQPVDGIGAGVVVDQIVRGSWREHVCKYV